MKRNNIFALSIFSLFLVIGLTGCEQRGESIPKFTVTFDAGTGGTLTDPATVQVETGETIAKPKDPTREGFSFVEWQKADGTAFIFNSETVTADITLTAQWQEIILYTVTFDANQGMLADGSASNAVQVAAGAKITKPTDPTRAGFTFVNWQKPDGGGAFDFTTDAITANITLTAQWKEVIQQYTVTFDANQGLLADGSDRSTVQVAAGEKVTKPTDPTRDGFTFVEWQDADSKTFDFNTAIAANITLTADWKSTSPGAVSNVVIELDPNAMPTECRVASYVYTDGDGTVVPNSTAEVKWLVSDNPDGTSATEVSTEATYSPVGVNRYKFVSASVRVESAENGYTPEEKSTTSVFPGFSTKATGSTNKFTAHREAGAVKFNNKMWIIGGVDAALNNSDAVWSSSDGVTWAKETLTSSFGARRKHTVLSFSNKMWVIGGFNGSTLDDVWSSTDGVKWTQSVIPSDSGFTARYDHTSVVFNSKMWVIGGNSGVSSDGRLADVWSSSDGITWVQSTILSGSGFPDRYNHTSVVHNGKMWVIGGQRFDPDNTAIPTPVSLADVWSSSDGTTWTQSAIPSGSGFPGRRDHTSVVHDSKMWVIGGYVIASRTALDDVWWSSDGATWKRALENAGFSARYNHTSVFFDNKIFVLGGFDGQSTFDDAWY